MSTEIAKNFTLVAIGLLFGWLLAHAEISTECDRLKGFYVGDVTYSCSVKEELK